jgi:predicted enzyme related to lactoylglutathione lyase
MEMMHNAASWFEIPVADFDRAKRFYSTIYNFDMPEMVMGPVKMGILLHDRTNGGIGGAIVCGEGYVPSKTGAKVYLNGGSDLSVVLDRVVPAGGAIVVGKTAVGDMGFIAIVEDTEGNYISLHSLQ